MALPLVIHEWEGGAVVIVSLPPIQWRRQLHSTTAAAGVLSLQNTEDLGVGPGEARDLSNI